RRPRPGAGAVRGERPAGAAGDGRRPQGGRRGTTGGRGGRVPEARARAGTGVEWSQRVESMWSTDRVSPPVRVSRRPVAWLVAVVGLIMAVAAGLFAFRPPTGWRPSLAWKNLHLIGVELGNY